MMLVANPLRSCGWLGGSQNIGLKRAQNKEKESMEIEPDSMVNGYEGMTSEGGSDGKGKSRDGLSLFMNKLPVRDKPYRVRLLCEPVCRRKHWDAFRPLKQYPLSPAEKVEQKDLDVAWSQGYWVPRRRMWAAVFDRDNNSMIRVLEAGPQVFDPIGSYFNMTKKTSSDGKGINPAGNRGPDWLIEVKVDKDGKTQYVVLPDPAGPSPFTEEEKKRMKETKVNRDWLLTKICVKATPEQIKELYAQLPDDKKKAPKRAKKGEEPFRQPDTSAVSNTDTDTNVDLGGGEETPPDVENEGAEVPEGGDESVALF